MKLRIARSARADLVRIDIWLGAIDGVLASMAQAAISDRIELLLELPGIGSPMPGGRRKLNEDRFGYRIIYRVKADQIEIIRIRHQREDWR